MNLPFQFFRMKRSMTKPARKLVGVLSFLFVCFVAALPASAQTPRKVIIAVSNPDNVTFFPLYYAKEAGYFREQGLEPQFIVMEGKDFKAGGMRQTMALGLTPKGNDTEIVFETDVNVFGRLGTLGYPFVKKKAEAVIKEFGDKVKGAIEGIS